MNDGTYQTITLGPVTPRAALSVEKQVEESFKIETRALRLTTSEKDDVNRSERERTEDTILSLWTRKRNE